MAGQASGGAVANTPLVERSYSGNRDYMLEALCVVLGASRAGSRPSG